MTLYALVSPGGAAGVTTTALALTLTWPRPVLLAECDPGCGDILAGLFAGHLTAPRGLLGVAFEAGRGPAAVAAELGSQLVPLDGSGQRAFLAGISDPRQVTSLAPAWPAVTAALAGQATDVIADCGRLDAGEGYPLSVLSQAAAVVLVLRPTLRQVAGARPRIEMLSQLLGGTERLGLVLVGTSRGHGGAEIAKALGVPVRGSLPIDVRTAEVLSDGRGRRTSLAGRPLLQAAKAAGQAMIQAAAHAKPDEPSAVPSGSIR
ncbi:MAG TPA: hypothetical protein VNF47_27455 [Streptosporangiaceae bacterium]|nr:hypothetical protein [Streptosporangiaceae bacterium]